LNQIAPYQPYQAPATNAAMPVPVQPYAVATTRQANESWTIKEKVVYSLLGLVGVTGSIWLGRKIILSARSNKEQNSSFEDGSSATTAKQIKMAFENDGWWGTNVTALREALTSVESQDEWSKVIKSYEKLYSTPTEKANLLKDLSSELQSTEYNEMLQIINAKPQKKGQAPAGNQYRAWAKRLKAAFDKEYGFLPGTDSAAVTVTLNEIPTQDAFIQTGVEYKRLFASNLMDDLKAEGEFGQSDEWMSIIFQKRKK
jgi:hypothetical protein